MIKPLALLWAYSISDDLVSTNEIYAKLHFQNGNDMFVINVLQCPEITRLKHKLLKLLEIENPHNWH
tara:strand:- start:575 stop:775 length:201 start_codon:yes stop_codon:yes gene_type:complete